MPPFPLFVIFLTFHLAIAPDSNPEPCSIANQFYNFESSACESCASGKVAVKKALSPPLCLKNPSSSLTILESERGEQIQKKFNIGGFHYTFGEVRSVGFDAYYGVDPLLACSQSCDSHLTLDAPPSVMIVEHITSGANPYILDAAGSPVTNAVRCTCVPNITLASLSTNSSNNANILPLTDGHCNAGCLNSNHNKFCPRLQTVSSLHHNASYSDDYSDDSSNTLLDHSIAIFDVPRRGSEQIKTTCIDCQELPIDLRFFELNDPLQDHGIYDKETYIYDNHPIQVKDTTHNRCSFCNVLNSEQVYSDSEASASCVQCGKGKYSFGLSSGFVAYNYLVYKPTCRECVLGSFNDEDGSEVCKNCPEVPAYDYQAVRDQYYSTREDVVNCLGNEDQNNFLLDCNFCSANTFCSPPYSSQVACPQTTDAGWSALSLCPVGSYCEGPNTVLCESGEYSGNAGAVACSKCESPGLKASEDRTACVACSAGNACFWVGDEFVNEPCPPGKFSGASASNCTLCVPGRYSATEASTICEFCRAGYTCAEEGDNGDKHIAENPCPPGSFSDAGSIACTSCPAAKTTWTSDGAKRLLSAATKIADCEDCIAGVACTQITFPPRTVVTRCAQNYNSASAGKEVCDMCELGKHRIERYPDVEDELTTEYNNSVFLSVSCQECPPGTTCCFGPGSPCENRNSGDPSAALELQVPLNCSRGRYSGESGVTDEVCSRKCPAGKFYGDMGGGKTNVDQCATCELGKYCSGDWTTLNQPEPQVCPANHYCQLGVATPVPCAMGYSTNGKTNMWHNDNCTVCHYGKTTNNELGGSCEACPAGKISTVDLGGTRCFDCPNEDACLGYGYHNCSEGYEGNLCGSCISGYYALGKTCNKCAKTPIITIIGVSIAIILGWALSKIELSFHHLIRLKIYSTFAQLLGLIMYVDVPWPPLVKKFTDFFLVFSLNVEVLHPECAAPVSFYTKYHLVIFFPALVSSFFFFGDKYLKKQMKQYSHKNKTSPDTNSSDSKDSFASSVGSMSSIGSNSFSSISSTVTTTTQPTILFKSHKKSKDDIKMMHAYRRKFKTLRQFLVIFISCTYTPLVQYSLKMFSCVETGTGRYLAVDTSLVCSMKNPEYFFNAIGAVFIIVGVGCGIPGAICALVKHLKNKLNTAKSLVYWGALYEWYRDEYAWFEAASLARKLMLLLSLSLLEDGGSQALAMGLVSLVYAVIIHKKKPFILFPLRMLVFDTTVDFYNFLEVAATLTCVFNLFLGSMANLDTTQEAADSIGLVFVFTNVILIVVSVGSYEYGIHHNHKLQKNKFARVKLSAQQRQEKKREKEKEAKVELELKIAKAEELVRTKKNEGGKSSKWKLVKNIRTLGVGNQTSRENDNGDGNGEGINGIDRFVGHQRRKKGDAKLDIKKLFPHFFAKVKDPVVIELSFKYEEEFNLMRASMKEMNLGDAHAIKSLLYRTRLQLVDELELLDQRYNEVGGEMPSDDQFQIDDRLKSDCSDFLHRVVSDWPESKEHKLSSKLSELCIQYSNWRAGYRTRLTNILKLEEAEFERQDRERKALLMESVFDLEDDNEHELFPGHTGEIETGAGGTRSSPDRSITSRNHSSNSSGKSSTSSGVSRANLISESFRRNKHRHLSLATAGELRLLSQESSDEVENVNKFIEAYVSKCLKTLDFLVAQSAQEFKERVLFEHEEDEDCVSYGLDPSNEGRRRITDNIRSRELAKVLPYFGFSCMLLSLCQASICAQAFGSFEGITGSFLSIIAGFLCFYSITRKRRRSKDKLDGAHDREHEHDQEHEHEHEQKHVNLTLVFVIGLLNMPCVYFFAAGFVKDTSSSLFRNFKSVGSDYLGSSEFLNRRRKYVRGVVHEIGGKRYGNYSNEVFQEDRASWKHFWRNQHFTDSQYCPDSLTVPVVGKSWHGWDTTPKISDDIYENILGLSHVYGSCSSCGFGGGFNFQETVNQDLVYYPGKEMSSQITDVLYDYEFGVRGAKAGVHRCEVDGFTNVEDDTIETYFGFEKVKKYWMKEGHCVVTGSLSSKLVRDGMVRAESENEKTPWKEQFFNTHLAGIHRCMSCDEENGFELVCMRAQRGLFDRRMDSGWCSGVCVKTFTDEGRVAVNELKSRLNIDEKNAKVGKIRNFDLKTEVRFENLLAVSGLFCVLLLVNSVCLCAIAFFGKSTVLFNPQATAIDAAKIDKFLVLALSVLCIAACLIAVQKNLEEERYDETLYNFVGQHVLSLDSWRVGWDPLLGFPQEDNHNSPFGRLDLRIDLDYDNGLRDNYILGTSAFAWLSRNHPIMMSFDWVLFFLGLFATLLHIYKEILKDFGKISLRGIETVFFSFIVKNKTLKERKRRRQLFACGIMLGIVVVMAWVLEIWKDSDGGGSGANDESFDEDKENVELYRLSYNPMVGLFWWLALVGFLANVTFFAHKKLRQLSLLVDFVFMGLVNSFVLGLLVYEYISTVLNHRFYSTTLLFVFFAKGLGLVLSNGMNCQLLVELRTKCPIMYLKVCRRLTCNNRWLLRVMQSLGLLDTLGEDEVCDVRGGRTSPFSLDFETIIDTNGGKPQKGGGSGGGEGKRKEGGGENDPEIEMSFFGKGSEFFGGENPMLHTKSNL